MILIETFINTFFDPKTVSNLREHFFGDQKLELVIFEMEKETGFTGLGMFAVERSTISSFINCAITYIIALL